MRLRWRTWTRFLNKIIALSLSGLTFKRIYLAEVLLKYTVYNYYQNNGHGGRAVNTIESCNPYPKTKYTKYFICLDSFPAYATLDKYSLRLDIFSKNVFSRILSRRRAILKSFDCDPWMNLRVQRLRTKVTKVKFMFGGRAIVTKKWQKKEWQF